MNHRDEPDLNQLIFANSLRIMKLCDKLEKRPPTPRAFFCAVCEHTDHNARVLPSGAQECPARVVRVLPEPGSLVPGSDPGAR